jgi:type I restriction enzyme R subunit
VIRNFIYFPDSSRREEKVLCRYPQYYAANKLYQNLLKHMRIEANRDEVYKDIFEQAENFKKYQK